MYIRGNYVQFVYTFVCNYVQFVCNYVQLTMYIRGNCTICTMLQTVYMTQVENVNEICYKALVCWRE